MSYTCPYCHHHCTLQEGKTGFCRVRTLQDGKNVCGNYGFLTSLALDPIEKKPLNRFYPGTTILSLGSYGFPNTDEMPSSPLLPGRNRLQPKRWN